MQTRYRTTALLVLFSGLTALAQGPDAARFNSAQKKSSSARGQRGPLRERSNSQVRPASHAPKRRGKAAAKQPAASNPETFTVYMLKFAEARSVGQLLGEMVPGAESLRISIDERTNRLIVFGDNKAQKLVGDVLKTLDVPRKEINRVVVYKLRYIAADPSLMDILRIAGGSKGNFAFDVASNSVVVSTSQDVHEIVAKLLERLDSKQRVRNAADQKWQVRVVWLTAGAEIGQPVPQDLENVVKELARIGITKPRMTAQVVVSASESGKFSARGRALLKEAADLTVSGKLSSRKTNGEPANPLLAITIDATSVAAPGGGRNRNAAPIASIETSIAAPVGHSVVLGVTPFEKMTSVFVVQISAK